MRFLAALLLALVSTPALAADTGMLLAGVSRPSASAYTGPGDIVSGATAWYGLRAYSAAVAATGTQKAVNVRRASDNATQDILILTNGNLDVASYNTFVGTDATASCTIAGTSMACTGASATIHVNDPVTGVGITNPCTVTATNGSTTATASIAGTSTSCGTVSVAETVTFQVAGFATKIYDQSGANNCSASACDASQATAANQPQVLPICSGSLPCLTFLLSKPQLLTATNSTTAGPMSYEYVGERIGSFTTQQFVFNCGGGGNPLYYTSSANTIVYNNGTNNLSATASDSVNHSITGVGGAGSSGSITVDGSTTPGNGGTNACTAAAWSIGATSGASSAFTGNVFEVGAWPIQFSGGNITGFHTNNSSWYGTP